MISRLLVKEWRLFRMGTLVYKVIGVSNFLFWAEDKFLLRFVYCSKYLSVL